MDWETCSDEKLVKASLDYWANYVETGQIHLNALDAEASGQPFNALSTEQHELVVRLRNLSSDMIKRGM